MAMSRSDKIFSVCLLSCVIGIPTAIMWMAAHFDPRVPPCLKSHTEYTGPFELFNVPASTRVVCDEWTIKR
jgi:hypothetical protein